MTRKRSLSKEQHREIALIKAALGSSDRQLHHYAGLLDQLDRTAAAQPRRDLSVQRALILEKIHAELVGAQHRLGKLNTTLRAQEDLRQALIDSAAGYEAWGFALRSQKLDEITSARTRMQRHFGAAADHGQRGTTRLERGI